MVFWSLAVQSIKFVSWLNFSEMGGSIFPDCWFSQAVISNRSTTVAVPCSAEYYHLSLEFVLTLIFS